MDINELQEISRKFDEYINGLLITNAVKACLGFGVCATSKMSCNNWRKTHGLPLIRKRKKR